MAPCLLLGVESSREAGAILRGGRAGELCRRQDGHFQHAGRHGTCLDEGAQQRRAVDLLALAQHADRVPLADELRDRVLARRGLVDPVEHEDQGAALDRLREHL